MRPWHWFWYDRISLCHSSLFTALPTLSASSYLYISYLRHVYYRTTEHKEWILCNEIVHFCYRLNRLSGARRDGKPVRYRRPSTMMIWYPKLVLTRPEVTGLSTVEGVSWKAASWKGPTMLPRVIHPRLPPAEQRKDELTEPCQATHDIPLALSSEYSCATLLNDWPSWIRIRGKEIEWMGESTRASMESNLDLLQCFSGFWMFLAKDVSNV